MISKIVPFKNAIICGARNGRIVIYQVGEEGERLWCDFNNTKIDGNILDIHICKETQNKSDNVTDLILSTDNGLYFG